MVLLPGGGFAVEMQGDKMTTGDGGEITLTTGEDSAETTSSSIPTGENTAESSSSGVSFGDDDFFPQS